MSRQPHNAEPSRRESAGVVGWCVALLAAMALAMWTGFQREVDQASVTAGPQRADLSQAEDCRWPAEIRASCSAEHTGGEMDLCLVASGCYVMGAPRSEPDAGRSSNVQVQVTLSRDFALGRTEVTRAQWESVGLSQPATQRANGGPSCLSSDCPVVNVGFQDAVAFANLYSDRFGLPRCYEMAECTGRPGEQLECAQVQLTADSAYECQGFRLPTEAEWEYAARAGRGSTYFGGAAVVGARKCVRQPALDDYAWYCWNSGSRDERDEHWPVGLTHAVGLKKANAWGLHDTHGNVREWVNDLYFAGGYGQGPLMDPPGVLTPGRDLLNDRQGARVTRGGCQFASRKTLASYDRHADSGTDSVQGMRLAITLKP